MDTMLTISVGVIFVAVYACDRFNTPPTNRASTTAASFYTAMGSYCALGVIAYFLLINYPALLKFTLQTVGKDWVKSLPDSMMGSQSVPLLAALLLTVALPKIPLIAKLDDKVMKQLQNIAAIPRQERDLASELSRSTFTVGDDVREHVRQKLATRIADEDIVFDKDASPHYLWTKIASLMYLLEGWDGFRGPVRFVTTLPGGDWADLEKRFETLGFTAQTCFDLIREQLANPGGPRSSYHAVREYRRGFEEQAEELLRGVYRFISRGVLQAHFTHRARVTQLKELGFDAQLSRPVLSIDQLVWLFLLTTTVFAAGLALLGPGSADNTWTPVQLARLGLRSVMIASIYVVAIWCAIYPKTRWAFARRRPDALPPVSAYFLSGGMAAAAGALISFGFKSAIFYPRTRTALENIAETWPWLLMSFTTAFAAAWLCDGVTERASLRLRWIETGTQAMVAVATGAVVWTMLHVTAAADPRVIPPIASVLLLSAVIGAAVGYWVPTWYRAARAEHAVA
jgi:hypothetical protein